MKHLYFVVNCKNCGNLCAVKYLGEDIGGIELGMATLEHFLYTCRGCGQSREYQQEETRVERFDYPPPEGWSTDF